MLTSRENVSLSRNSFKSGSLCSTGWFAILKIHFSRASLLCCTKEASNRLKGLFSGTGGTTTPGLLFDNVSYNQRKSEYRRRTEKADLENKGEFVCVNILSSMKD